MVFNTYFIMFWIGPMSWTVSFHPEFELEFYELVLEVQDELLAHAKLLEKFGPALGRPRVETLQGSIFANMKELRFDAGDVVWRVALPFDLERKAVLLTAEDKSGVSQRRFYGWLIAIADKRFSSHQMELKERRKHDNAQRIDGEVARKKASKDTRSR